MEDSSQKLRGFVGKKRHHFSMSSFFWLITVNGSVFHCSQAATDAFWDHFGSVQNDVIYIYKYVYICIYIYMSQIPIGCLKKEGLFYGKKTRTPGPIRLFCGRNKRRSPRWDDPEHGL